MKELEKINNYVWQFETFLCIYLSLVYVLHLIKTRHCSDIKIQSFLPMTEFPQRTFLSLPHIRWLQTYHLCMQRSELHMVWTLASMKWQLQRLLVLWFSIYIWITAQVVIREVKTNSAATLCHNHIKVLLRKICNTNSET